MSRPKVSGPKILGQKPVKAQRIQLFHLYTYLFNVLNMRNRGRSALGPLLRYSFTLAQINSAVSHQGIDGDETDVAIREIKTRGFLELRDEKFHLTTAGVNAYMAILDSKISHGS